MWPACVTDIYLASVTGNNACEAMSISLFWAPSGLNELPEVHFKFPFILIGHSTMAFLTGQESWCRDWFGGCYDWTCVLELHEL